MPLSEAMQTQRAIRRLKPDAVDDEVVLRLIGLAIRAPTGSNAQNWEFIVVRDTKIKKGLARLNRQVWQLSRRIALWTARHNPTKLKILDSVQWQADHFEEIPVIVIACLKGLYLPFLHISATSYFGSIFPSVQNLLLAARAVNLGAALTTIPLWNLIAVRRILGLPWDITPCVVIPLGWPLGHYGPTTRKAVHEVVSFDRFGNRPAVHPSANPTGDIPHV
ncbi:MAG: nitroreductase [Chloroflexi bacterium RIFOXYC12_FULL_59_14]|nr:MAG: nitroreductase [Chloroflexi bacterium RIFOXYC12_FULL_59_14]